MISKKGITGLNAETTIDLETGKVDFSYPVIKTTKDLKKQIQIGYSQDLIAQISGFLISYLCIVWWAYNLKEVYMIYDPLPPLILIYVISMMLFFAITPIYITKIIAIGINMIFPKIRENYPKRQSLKRDWQKIELPTTDGAQIIRGKELFILDYHIARFEYKYIGENKLEKIEVKSIETKEHKGEHFEFIAIMTFKQPITDGILLYR